MRAVVCFMVLLPAVLAGCEGPPQVHDVQHIQVMTPPMASNLDGFPGLDGVQAKVYLFRGQDTVIGNGTLEVLMFDGKVPRGEVGRVEPLKAWSFSPQDLLQLRAREYGLWQYRLILPWGPNPPKAGGITLVAQYHDKPGRVLYSEPVYVPVAPK